MGRNGMKDERPLEQHMREEGHGEAFDLFLEGYKPPSFHSAPGSRLRCGRCGSQVVSAADHSEWHLELSWSIWLLQKTALSYLGGPDA